MQWHNHVNLHNIITSIYIYLCCRGSSSLGAQHLR